MKKYRAAALKRDGGEMWELAANVQDKTSALHVFPLQQRRHPTENLNQTRFNTQPKTDEAERGSGKEMDEAGAEAKLTKSLD